MEDTDWSRLIDQLRNGECTPLLGAGACRPPLPTGEELSRALAEGYAYPFADCGDLSRVTQYAAILHDPATVKGRVAQLIKEKGYPDFMSDAEPHALLAQFRLPVYLTTNYDDFMMSALAKADRLPRANICRWWDALKIDNDHDPSADRPIVYHLHGSCADIPSLVLTEGDYLDYLINLTVHRGDDGRMPIPAPVLNALTKPLLFIGYTLQDWAFRVVFYGLLRRLPRLQQRRHVSVQLLPPLSDDPDARERAERYLNSYFEEWKISVFWGTAQEFCAELRTRLEGS